MGDWMYMVEVPGDPIGKGRPRGASIGGKVRLYTPKKTADWERSAAMVMTSMWRKAPLDEPVEVEIAAFAHRRSVYCVKRTRITPFGSDLSQMQTISASVRWMRWSWQAY